MILSGDEAALCVHELTRLIVAAVAVFHFERRRPGSQGQLNERWDNHYRKQTKKQIQTVYNQNRPRTTQTP